MLLQKELISAETKKEIYNIIHINLKSYSRNCKMYHRISSIFLYLKSVEKDERMKHFRSNRHVLIFSNIVINFLLVKFILIEILSIF